MFDFWPDLKVGWILKETLSFVIPLSVEPTVEVFRLSPNSFIFGASSGFWAEIKLVPFLVCSAP